MNVVFRVDASRQIGTGHVMRCLALAEGLRERGANVSFICADLEGSLIEYLREAGYTVHSLSRPAANRKATEPGDRSPYETWLGAPWQADAKQTRTALENGKHDPDYLIVDHYGLDHRWEETLAPMTRKTLVIDDLADRRHACDILLDQNLPGDGDTRYRGLANEDTVTLLGPRYALLRPEFTEAGQKSDVRDAGLRRLLIMFGGFDETGETLKALRGVSEVDADIAIDVVVSFHNRRVQEIERLVSDLTGVSLAVQPPDIASIMARADFSLGAGGITLWERCAVSLPSASTVVAENQRAQIRAAKEAGLTLLTGDAENTDKTGYREIIHMVRQNPALLKRMSQTCGNAVDGRGVQRIIAVLEETTVETTQ